MNDLVAKELVGELIEFNWLHTYAGLVRVVEYNKGQGLKKIPVGDDVVDPSECDDTTVLRLVPDGTKPSILYFEDRGTGAGRNRRPGESVAKLRLVCWMNTDRLGPNAAALIEAQVKGALSGKSIDSLAAPLTYLRVLDCKTVKKSKQIFSQYTYDEARQQYLAPPYDYFAIDIEARYRVDINCSLDPGTSDPSCGELPTTWMKRYPDQFSCDELNSAERGLTDDQKECIDGLPGGGEPGECDPVSIRKSDDVTEVAQVAAGGSFPIPTHRISRTKFDNTTEVIQTDEYDEDFNQDRFGCLNSLSNNLLDKNNIQFFFDAGLAYPGGVSPAGGKLYIPAFVLRGYSKDSEEEATPTTAYRSVAIVAWTDDNSIAGGAMIQLGATGGWAPMFEILNQEGDLYRDYDMDDEVEEGGKYKVKATIPDIRIVDSEDEVVFVLAVGSSEQTIPAVRIDVKGVPRSVGYQQYSQGAIFSITLGEAIDTETWTAIRAVLDGTQESAAIEDLGPEWVGVQDWPTIKAQMATSVITDEATPDLGPDWVAGSDWDAVRAEMSASALNEAEAFYRQAKFYWEDGDTDTAVWTLTDDEAKTMTTFVTSGTVGSVTYSLNASTAAALPASLTLSSGDTIQLFRTDSSGQANIKMT